MTAPSAAARITEEVLGFVFSNRCAGCDAPAAVLCAQCRAALCVRVLRRSLPSGTPVLATCTFEGVAARTIRALKEQGRTALARPLGKALAVALHEAGASRDAIIVPIPTSRAAFRRRGFRVPELLVRQAGFRPCRLLLPARATADQRGLSIDERERNVRGIMRVPSRALALSASRRVFLVDDVTTTGATFAEAEWVLRTAGCRVEAAVACASTPRRSGGGIPRL